MFSWHHHGVEPTSDLPTVDARRDRLIEAAEVSGFDTLRDLVKSLLGEGVAKETLLEDLSQIRALVDEEAEENVLDVLDLLVGWCAQEFRLGD